MRPLAFSLFGALALVTAALVALAGSIGGNAAARAPIDASRAGARPRIGVVDRARRPTPLTPMQLATLARTFGLALVVEQPLWCSDDDGGGDGFELVDLTPSQIEAALE